MRNGTSVNTIVSRIEDELAQKEKNYLAEGYSQDKIEKELGDDKRQLQVVQNALKNDPEMGKLYGNANVARQKRRKTGCPSLRKRFTQTSLKSKFWQRKSRHFTENAYFYLLFHFLRSLVNAP